MLSRQKRANKCIDMQNNATYLCRIHFRELKMSKTLSLTKLADHVGIKKRTLHNMIKDGRFPVEPIKGTQPRLWSTKDVDAWMDGE